jgi:Flp pilus assembly protein TadD
MMKVAGSVELAIASLRRGDPSEAEEHIREAAALEPHSGAIQNLFGILAEVRGDPDLARRHYLSACALDPTYKPAYRNLRRITFLEQGGRRTGIDYGDEPEVRRGWIGLYARKKG